MRPDQHTLRSRVFSPDIRYGDATTGPTRHPTNALAMRAARPIKKKLPAISTAQAMLRTRPATTPVTIGKQPTRPR